MKEPALPEQPERPAGSRVDLDHVNPLQQAVIDRARAAGERGKWLPEMTITQGIISVLIAIVVVYGIFRAVDKGLEAFQRFAEVSMESGQQQPAQESTAAPEVDVTQPVPIILVPEDAPPETSPPPAPPP